MRKKSKNVPKKSKNKGKSYYRFEIPRSKIPNKNKELEIRDEDLYRSLLNQYNVYIFYNYIYNYSNLIISYSNGDPRWYDYSRSLSLLYDNYSVNFYRKGKFQIQNSDFYTSVSILENYLVEYLKDVVGLKRISSIKVSSVCRWFCYGCYRAKSLNKIVGTYTRNQNNYAKESSDVSYSYVRYLIDMLKLFELVICFNGYNYDNLSRVNSCFIINPRLFDILDMKKDLTEYFSCIGDGKPETFVKVRSEDYKGKNIDMRREDMNPSDMPILDMVEEILEEANKLINNSTISVNGIPIPEIWFTRIYKNTIYEYGRIFDNGEIQTKTKYYRSLIKIDGMETVTLDIKSLHPRMIMEMKGIKADTDYDPYLSEGIELDVKLINKFKKFYKIDNYNPIRNLSKVSLLCLINASSEESAIKAIREKLFNDNLRKGTRHEDQLLYLGLPNECFTDKFLKDWVNKLKQHNHYIKDWLGAGKSGKLQNLDGDIMFRCIEKLTKVGVVALPVHDALICAEPQKSIVEGVMRESYKEVLGTDFNLIIEEE